MRPAASVALFVGARCWTAKPSAFVKFSGVRLLLATLTSAADVTVAAMMFWPLEYLVVADVQSDATVKSAVLMVSETLPLAAPPEENVCCAATACPTAGQVVAVAGHTYACTDDTFAPLVTSVMLTRIWPLVLFTSTAVPDATVMLEMDA